MLLPLYVHIGIVRTSCEKGEKPMSYIVPCCNFCKEVKRMSVWVYLLLLYPFVGVFNLIVDLFLLFMHWAGLYQYMYACVQNCLSLTDLLCNLFGFRALSICLCPNSSVNSLAILSYAFFSNQMKVQCNYIILRTLSINECENTICSFFPFVQMAKVCYFLLSVTLAVAKLGKCIYQQQNATAKEDIQSQCYMFWHVHDSLWNGFSKIYRKST